LNELGTTIQELGKDIALMKEKIDTTEFQQRRTIRNSSINPALLHESEYLTE
jgi:hypothetical protein